MVGSDFVGVVRQARTVRGWNQAELGKRVGKSQRAVSTWERGTAVPEPAVKARVMEVLGLHDPAAGSASRAGLAYPGRAPVSELPFETLSPDDFEEFTTDLLDALYGSANRVGKSGHKQGGYDVHAVENGKIVLGAQCKREAQFGPTKVSAAVEEVRKAVAADGADKVDSSVIALSRIASPGARKELRKHRGWQLWDRNDLSRKVRGLEQDRAVRIVKRFFPTLLTGFLGVAGTGPWLDGDEYLDRWHNDKIYSHRWHMVGGTGTVDALAEFATGGDGRVALLTGLAGSGKTKILTEVCVRAAGSAVAVRVLEPDHDVDAGSCELLPSGGALLVIVDDAHNEDVPLGKIVAGVRKANPQANILVSLRPYGLPRVREELRRVGDHTDEILEKTVPELDLDSATELAREVLDEPVRHHGPRLAAAASDCPLLIVTGAALINRGQLDPSDFENSEQLHRELITGLADALTAQSAAENPARRDVLTALAAYQPVDLADGQTRTSLETLTGLDFAQVMPHLAGLEDAGLVLRRGTKVRVVPDLLGDALLNQASLDRGSGVLTGFLDKALRAAVDAARRNLIINAGRVDWQVGSTGPDGAGLIESLWQDLDDAFRDTDPALRTRMLELVAKVAFFQPRRALAMVRWAMANPVKTAITDIGLGYVSVGTDADVRHALAPVLRPIAWYPELFPDAAELLWELVLDDFRGPILFPDHPRRVLHELASFSRQGPTGQQRLLVGLVGRWLNRHEGSGTSSPLMVLEPLLAIAGSDEKWLPDALVFHPYVLSPTQEILQLRDSVFQLAFSQLGADDLAWAAAAIDLIGAGFTSTPPPFGGTIDEQVQQAWNAHFAEVLDRLAGHLAEARLDPALLVAIRERLQWTGEHGPEQLRRVAQAITATMPVTPENTLARALHGGPVDPVDAPNLEARSQSRQALFADAIKGIVDWPDEQAAERISALLADERQVFGPDAGQARPFLWDLIISRPVLGAAMCAHAIAAPDSTLVSQMSITLVAMSKAGAPETIDWAQRLLADGRAELAQQVGHALGLQRNRSELLPGEDDILRELAGHPDHVVTSATAGAARYLAAGYPDLALELIFTTLPNGGLREAVTIFRPQTFSTLPWAQLPAGHKALILGQLAEYPSLDDYEIGQFLEHVAAQEPDSVVELLQNRVEDAEHETAEVMFSALPHTPLVSLPFRQSARFPDLLRRVREWLATAPQSFKRATLGGELFAMVAGTFDDQVLDVVFDYTDTPDPVKMQVVATMLRSAPRELVWNTEAVRRVLRAADRSGTDSLRAVQGALLRAASRDRCGTPFGQPFAEDVELRDRSEALAATYPPGSVENQFYGVLAESARRTIAWTLADDRPEDHRSWS